MIVAKRLNPNLRWLREGHANLINAATSIWINFDVDAHQYCGRRDTRLRVVFRSTDSGTGGASNSPELRAFPPVRLLQGKYFPRGAAVGVVAIVAFAVIFGLGTILVAQVHDLAKELPQLSAASVCSAPGFGCLISTGTGYGGLAPEGVAGDISLGASISSFRSCNRPQEPVRWSGRHV
jgi:hypothetical protein